ncbi:MAG: hypothetical protein IKN49_04605 [Elusimicrobiaceae bacterium]|nr:hypothetical protein [Elusimicrobiaceae bacterium]
MAKYNIRTLKEKEAIWKFYQKHGWKSLCEKYSISRSTLSNWKLRITSAKPSDEHPLARRYHVGPEIRALFKQLYKDNPGISLQELQEKAAHKQLVSKTAIWHIVTGR